MKKLLLVLLFGFAAQLQAASTDTVTPSTDTMEGTLQSIAADMANFVIDMQKEIEAAVPVEQKVVEIHMSAMDEETEVKTTTIRKNKGMKLPLMNIRRGICSGAFVTDSGDIITAKHCVDGYTEFEVKTSDQRAYTAVVVATSSVHDLALIHIDRRNTPFFELADTVDRGQRVYALGSPLGNTDTLTTGLIAKIDGDVLLLDVSVLPGNSGGPLFDVDHRLVGIVHAVHLWGFGVTHLGRAQGLDAVHFFLKKALKEQEN